MRQGFGILRAPLFWLIAAVLAGGTYALWPATPDRPAAGPDRPPDATADSAATAGAATGAAMVAVTVPELTAQQRRGQAAFDANCAGCHGADAAGRDGVAPPLIHKIYEPSHHGDAAIVRAVKQGARQHHWPFGNMPPVAGVADADIAAIIGYLRAVQRANGID